MMEPGGNNDNNNKDPDNDVGGRKGKDGLPLDGFDEHGVPLQGYDEHGNLLYDKKGVPLNRELRRKHQRRVSQQNFRANAQAQEHHRQAQLAARAQQIRDETAAAELNAEMDLEREDQRIRAMEAAVEEERLAAQRRKDAIIEEQIAQNRLAFGQMDQELAHEDRILTNNRMRQIERARMLDRLDDLVAGGAHGRRSPSRDRRPRGRSRDRSPPRWRSISPEERPGDRRRSISSTPDLNYPPEDIDLPPPEEEPVTPMASANDETESENANESDKENSEVATAEAIESDVADDNNKASKPVSREVALLRLGAPEVHFDCASPDGNGIGNTARRLRSSVKKAPRED